MNLNKAFVLGNVVRQPETRSLPSGQNVCTFSVATNRVWYDAQRNKKEDTQFHNIVTFAKLADIASQYLSKGSLVLIEGRIQTRMWEKDGQKNYRTEIVAETLQLGPRGSGGGGQQGGVAPAKKRSEESEVPTVSEDDINIEEEIPF